MKHKLFISGGCGFIGSNFIRRFLKAHPDWKLCNLDLLTYCGNRENTREFEKTPQYEFINADVRDASAVEAAMKGAEGVVHFAAESHVDRSIENAAEFLTTNILGTNVMLSAARKQGIKRFLHISTDEVYGSLPSGSAHENSPLEPNSPYSASKAAADLLIRSYRETYQFPAMIARSTNNFGPYQFPEKVIPLFITNMMEGKKVPLYGEGLNQRDWIHVEDNCDALIHIFERGKPGEIYNIGGGNEMTNLALTHTLLKIMGRGEDSIQRVTDRPGHDLRYSVDTRKIQSLGWKPKWNFEEALRATVRWYQENTAWWQPLKRDKFTLK